MDEYKGENKLELLAPGVIGYSGTVIARTDFRQPPGRDAEADMLRLIRSWNCCGGLSPDALAELDKRGGVGRVLQAVMQSRAERDAVLEVLLNMVEVIVKQAEKGGPDPRAMLVAAAKTLLDRLAAEPPK